MAPFVTNLGRQCDGGSRRACVKLAGLQFDELSYLVPISFSSSSTAIHLSALVTSLLELPPHSRSHFRRPEEAAREHQSCQSIGSSCLECLLPCSAPCHAPAAPRARRRAARHFFRCQINLSWVREREIGRQSRCSRSLAGWPLMRRGWRLKVSQQSGRRKSALVKGRGARAV